jgi:hypothetical protein
MGWFKKTRKEPCEHEWTEWSEPYEATMKCWGYGKPPLSLYGPYDSKYEEQERHCQKCGQMKTRFSDSCKKQLDAYLKAIGQSG